MHNPLLVIAIAVWATLHHIGMLVGMSANRRVTLPEGADPVERRAVARRRALAAGIAYGVAAAVTLTFALMRRHKASTHVTYWATLAILFFGLSYAVYHLVPKVYVSDPLPQDQEVRRQLDGTVTTVHAVSLLGAALAWVLARAMLVPLPSSSR